MGRVYVHSIVSVITNSSSEMFSVLKDGAVSKAREILERTLEQLGKSKMMDLFEVVAVVECNDGMLFICRTDDELRTANEYLNEHDYPKRSDIQIRIKESDLDIANLFADLKEEKDFMT